MQVIVQAGGKGTRLENLTLNRPKCLVPVNNIPILFHLFNKYKNLDFVIIGDYKYEVLEKYLKTYAKDINYKLIKSSGTGNVCGIKDALKYVKEDEKIMLIWSDLILSEEFKPEDLPQGNYVGILENQPCSWSFQDGVLEKTATETNGVAGCFIFENKDFLKEISTIGSFTGWLKNSGIELQPMKMPNCIETGSLKAIKDLKDTENRCRPYNKIEFLNNTVIKEGLTEQGKELINKEIDWYKELSKYGFDSMPKTYSLNPLTMERINGENIFLTESNIERKEIILKNLLNAINKMHNLEMREANNDDIITEYYSKTIDRINSIKDVVPFANDEFITINGKNCKNPNIYCEEFKQYVEQNLLKTVFCPIHGDCTLTNTMVDKDNNVHFIDPRGYFGSQKVFGDIRYDWAKLYYSIIGNFDRFNIKDFELKISDKDVEYKIKSNGWESLYEKFLSEIKDININEIKFIHSIIWLSLASHCFEDYDSMCLAFYNGVYLINEFI